MKLQKSVLQIGSLILSLGTLSACSDVRLAPLGKESVNVQSVGEFCTKDPEDIGGLTKFLFVIDKSGSNNSTDPNNARRADNIETFFNEKKAEKYIEWGYIVFGREGSNAEAYINAGGNRSNPVFASGDSGQMEQAIALQRSEGDNGCTPYSAAINLARTAIKTDIKAHPDQTNTYMVFFMSDGRPTDYTSAGGCGQDSVAGQAAFDDVDALVGIDPSHVFFSTAYYGPNDQPAADGLEKMSEHGHGKFINLERGNKIDFNDLIAAGPSKEPWQIKNFVVYNLNHSICEDGTFDTDSDGDGLCDRDEVKYGLDPTKRFSKPGGYSDYFIYRSMIYGEKLPPCTDRSDDDHDLLTYCEENYIVNQTPTGPSPNIKIPNHGDVKNPDTDLDGFIDGIELLMFHDKSSPMNARDVLTVWDNETDASTQIKEHRNPKKWDPTAFSYDTRIIPVETLPSGQTCYSFSQTKLLLNDTLAVSATDNFPELAHGKGENTVLTYFIQVPERDPMGRGIYMYSFQNLKRRPQSTSDSLGFNAGLKIDDTVFKAYVVPKE